MRFIIWLFLWFFVAFPGFAQTEMAKVHATQVSLISDHKVVKAGEPFRLGILMQMDPHWHTYWKNAGDTGFAAKVTWHLPDNSIIEEPLWPAPEKMVIENTLVNYVYENQLLLSHNTTLQGEVGSHVPIFADVAWLMCYDVCIPGKTSVATEVLIAEESIPNEGLMPLFEETAHKVPTPFTGELKVIQEETDYQLSFPIDSGEEAIFIPDAEGMIIDVKPQNFTVRDGVGYIFLERDIYGEERNDLTGLLQIKSADGVKTFTISALIEEGEVETSLNEGKLTHYYDNQEAEMTLLLAVISAFIAGVILNLMPCVLPVLFLKVTGLVHHAHGKYHKGHLLTFLLGVLVPFWALGAVLIILKQSGEVLGWGFHLQSPAFVGVLTIFILLISLNLFGVFELGTSLTRAGGKLKKTEGHSGAFASGVLMTLVATPCTVPFMGGAVAYGLSSSIVVALSVFTSLGAGMAAPYMLLAVSPNLLKHIPKPGVWMVTFRKILGVPMLLTAIWLFWVFKHQVTQQSLDAFGYALLAVILGSWLFGMLTHLSCSAMQKRLGTLMIVIALVLSSYMAISAEKLKEKVSTELGIWQEWSPATLSKALAEGRTVFVDFTADWCITCKFMEATVLSSKETQGLFKEHNVLLLKADWTLRDETITQALGEYGRKGVPLYVLYNMGNPVGQVLPQILSYDLLKERLTPQQSMR